MSEVIIRAYVRRLLPSRADADDVMQGVALVLWAKFEQFRDDGDFRSWALGVDDLEDGDVHFQITRQGLPKGGVQGAVTNDTMIGDPLPIGTWNHVAMVISNLDHGRRVYANGKLIREGVMEREISIRPGSCRIGNWLPSVGHSEKRTRALRGQMDELAIRNRALLESELRELVEAGRQNVLKLE